MDDPRRSGTVHRRGRAATRRRRLDHRGARRDRAARRVSRRPRLDLVRALVRRRGGGYGPRCRGAAPARGDAAGRCHARRRRDDIDVRSLDPDFLVFPTYKWLLGPYGRAFLYVAKRRQDGVPLEQTSYGRRAITSERESYYRDTEFV